MGRYLRPGVSQETCLYHQYRTFGIKVGMRIKNTALQVACLLATCNLFAQLTIPLKEVVVVDRRLSRYSEGYRHRILSDSVLGAPRSLSEILRDEALVFVRENGRGMISSPSIRGTSAAQTAILWNGINVNSPLNGQVDLNNWVGHHNGSLVLRPGGGSVLFGSGAIGGTLHLDNDLPFDRKLQSDLLVSYGSFESRRISLRQKGGKRKLSLNWGVTYQDSENDYTFPDTDQQNENGQFDNLSWSVNAGRKWKSGMELKLFHQGYRGNRNLSGTLLAPSNDRYTDAFTRTQFALERRSDGYDWIVRAAHLFEEYSFFESPDGPALGWGSSHVVLGRYEGTLKGSNFSWQHFVQGQQLYGRGGNIDAETRTELALSSLFQITASKSWIFIGSIRKDFSTAFESPWLFTIQWNGRMGKALNMKGNLGRNFRAPTFNDLFWTPGGNPELIPEQSVQWEVGLNGKVLKAIRWETTAFWIRTRDLIRWLPGTNQLWSPENVDQVWIQGVEASLQGRLIQSRRHGLTGMLSYGYIRAEDRRSGNPLSFTPEHQVRARLDWKWGRTGIYLRYLYTGPVRTTGNRTLSQWNRLDAGLRWKPSQKTGLDYELAIHLRNIFNEPYQLVPFRPMPGRNLTTQLLIHL